jgi:hypothetical protein
LLKREEQKNRRAIDMPNRADRVTTYRQAFMGVLGIPFDEKLQNLVKRLEKEGHTEKGISFSVWRSRDKLNAFCKDKRFMSILENEINKWSWKKDDPRWTEYWKRKNEALKALRIRKEIDIASIVKPDAVKENDVLNIISVNPKGYIYFIQGLCGGAIKIGFSVNPEKRLKALQTGYPDTLTILLMIPGNESSERIVHKTLETARLKGEWFRPDDFVIEKIKEWKSGLSRIGGK